MRRVLVEGVDSELRFGDENPEFDFVGLANIGTHATIPF